MVTFNHWRLYLHGKSSQYPLKFYGRLGSPHNQFKFFWQECKKTPCPYQQSNTNSSVISPIAWSLHQMHFPRCRKLYTKYIYFSRTFTQGEPQFSVQVISAHYWNNGIKVSQKKKYFNYIRVWHIHIYTHIRVYTCIHSYKVSIL